MGTLLLLAQLAAVALPVTMPPLPPPPPIFQHAQEPRVLPSHRVGPHEGEPGALCWRGATETRKQDGHTFYQCACQFLCEGMDQREADDCETSCSKDGSQCLCHTDETCQMPEIRP